MDKMPIDVIFKNQQDYFLSGETKNIGFRLAALKRLANALEAYEEKIFNGMKKDLHKSNFESYVSEMALLKSDIHHTLLNLPKWAAMKKVGGTKATFPSKSYIKPEPFGNVLVISPWNYPLLLSIGPVIGALAAGNTVILKPSEFSVHTSETLKEMADEFFDPNLFKVVSGDVEASKQLLEKPFNYIFFTGSTEVGKIVMKAAAEHLTPVTLELGGKSPTIVDKTADIDVTAKRLAWAKFMNAGQTCVGIDFMYVHESIEDELLSKMKAEIVNMFGSNPIESEDYPRIINQKHFNRLSAIIDQKKVTHGGKTEKSGNYIAPTILENASWDDAAMQEEIFGPILPVFTYSDLNEVLNLLERKPKPLAFHVFTKDKKVENEVIHRMSSGGVVVNDALVQLANHHLPFGGVGASGMGAYHGKFSFDTFTHYKSVFKRSFLADAPFRYAPFKDKLAWVRKFI